MGYCDSCAWDRQRADEIKAVRYCAHDGHTLTALRLAEIESASQRCPWWRSCPEEAQWHPRTV